MSEIIAHKTRVANIECAQVVRNAIVDATHKRNKWLFHQQVTGNNPNTVPGEGKMARLSLAR